MISKDGYADVNSILKDMERAASWRGRGAYGSPSLPDYETFKSLLMRCQDEIDKRNSAHISEFPIWGQRAVRIESPMSKDFNELHELYYEARALARENKPYEDKRDRICKIMLNTIEDYRHALEKATAL